MEGVSATFPYTKGSRGSRDWYFVLAAWFGLWIVPTEIDAGRWWVVALAVVMTVANAALAVLHALFMGEDVVAVEVRGRA